MIFTPSGNAGEGTEELKFPFARPLYVMAKPAGSVCNMRCAYCYYLEKGLMYPGATHAMSDELLELFIRQYIEAQSMPRVMFTWHGGEPLMRPLSFYEKVIKLQQRYAGGRIIDNCIQTNGTLITDDFARFLSENNWLTGVSIDGPADLHDPFRLTAMGHPSHSRVMHGIELLDRHGAQWNAMAVVNSLNVKEPERFYRFFKSIGCHYLQFTPIVERIVRQDDGRHLATPSQDGMLAPWTVDPDEWGDFLCAIYDEWVAGDVGTYFIHVIEAVLAGWVGVEPPICTLGSGCGHAAVLEHNGDLYSCDHFVFPEYRLGNIKRNSILEMMMSREQGRFGAMKRATLPRECIECEFTHICNGECPKNRFISDRYGNPGLNYLCRGYRRFFNYSREGLRAIAARYTAGLR